jgi:SAM-dependent methyltransferase
MEGLEQVAAYAAADFGESDRRLVDEFARLFGETLSGNVLDLGCGPGNMTFLFAERFRLCRVLGVDGSAAMIDLANRRKRRRPDLADRVRFIMDRIPGGAIPHRRYAAIVSNSLLHHLHRPSVLWQTVSDHASTGTRIFIADLFRPASVGEASEIVDTYAAGEPEVLRTDFLNSLLAAFEPGEVETQITEGGLGELRVARISDRHLIVSGEKR